MSKKTKKPKLPKLRKRAWVKVNFQNLHPTQRPHYKQHWGQKFIYLGEIPNQAGHSLVLTVGETLNVVVFHTDELVELTDDET